MPHKVTYGADFDDDYDIYDDYNEDNYEYNYGKGLDEHESGIRFFFFFLHFSVELILCDLILIFHPFLTM